MNVKLTDKLFVCNACKISSNAGFEIDLDRRFFNNIKICKECGKEIYSSLGKHFVHKGLKNINKEIKLVDKNF